MFGCLLSCLQESEAAVQAAIAQVLQQVAPLEAAWQAELSQLQGSEARRAELAEALQAMEKRTANLQ
jgi:ATPase subunit of ABC transporter with duplicated ATPase domains